MPYLWRLGLLGRTQSEGWNAMSHFGMICADRFHSRAEMDPEHAVQVGVDRRICDFADYIPTDREFVGTRT